MTRKALSPFAGKPKTRQITGRDGAPVFIVSPRVLTPFRAKIADTLTLWGAIAGIGFALLRVADMPGATEWHFAAAIGGPVIAAVVLKDAVRWLFKKRRHIKLSLDEVAVRRFFFWKRFDRQLPHKFSLIVHDKAQAERDMHEFQIMEGQLRKQPVRKSRYYTESWHLSFDYVGQRNDLLTVFGAKDAQAVLARLKAIDEVLDAVMRKGHGTPLSPQQEWGEQPGEIPEAVRA